MFIDDLELDDCFAKEPIEHTEEEHHMDFDTWLEWMREG